MLDEAPEDADGESADEVVAPGVLLCVAGAVDGESELVAESDEVGELAGGGTPVSVFVGVGDGVPDGLLGGGELSGGDVGGLCGGFFVGDDEVFGGVDGVPGCEDGLSPPGADELPADGVPLFPCAELSVAPGVPGDEGSAAPLPGVLSEPPDELSLGGSASRPPSSVSSLTDWPCLPLPVSGS